MRPLLVDSGLHKELEQLRALLVRAVGDVGARQAARQAAQRVRTLALRSSRWEAVAAADAAEFVATDLVSGRSVSAESWKLLERALVRARSRHAWVPSSEPDPAACLLITGNPELEVCVRAALAPSRLPLSVVHGAEEVPRAVGAAPPAVAVVDVETARSPLAAVRALRRLPGLGTLPIALVGGSGSFSCSLTAIRAGATLLLPSPVTSARLAETFAALGRRTARPSVVLLDADPARRAVTCAALQERGITPVGIKDADDLMLTLERLDPDAVLLRAPVPSVRIEDLCRVLRAAPQWRELLILVLHDPDCRAGFEGCFEAGVDGLVDGLDEAMAQIRSAAARRQGRSLRLYDAGSGVLSREAFVDVANRECFAARREWKRLFLLVAEVKVRFPGGGRPDGVERAGAWLEQQLRVDDLVGRLDPLRYAMLLSQPAPGAVSLIASRLVEGFRARVQAGGPGGRGEAELVVSGATTPDDGDTIVELIEVATGRLGQAAALRHEPRPDAEVRTP